MQLIVAHDALIDALGMPTQREYACVRRDDLQIDLPVRIKRCGKAVRFVLETGLPARCATPDTKMLVAIAKGLAWWQQLKSNPRMTLADLARSEGFSKNYVERVLRLSFLSPAIIQSILDGTKPADLTLERLKDAKLISPIWAEQHQKLGVSVPHR